MMNAFSSMAYPHWLIVAGTILLVLGFIGLAFRQRDAQADLEEAANGDESLPIDADLAETVVTREAMLEENKRAKGGLKGTAGTPRL
jgi:hypothetical protein